jgi:hypothetical protein
VRAQDWFHIGQPRLVRIDRKGETVEDITTAHKPSPAIFKLRLSAIALASLGAVFMVTMLIAATGDNIADAVLGQIDFSHLA